MGPDLSIIVASYKRCDALELCLGDLAAQDTSALRRIRTTPTAAVRAAIAAQGRVGLMLNVERVNLDSVLAALPAVFLVLRVVAVEINHAGIAFKGQVAFVHFERTVRVQPDKHETAQKALDLREWKHVRFHPTAVRARITGEIDEYRPIVSARYFQPFGITVQPELVLRACPSACTEDGGLDIPVVARRQKSIQFAERKAQEPAKSSSVWYTITTCSRFVATPPRFGNG